MKLPGQDPQPQKFDPAVRFCGSFVQNRIDHLEISAVEACQILGSYGSIRPLAGKERCRGNNMIATSKD
jgi:hypothetical protein